MVDCGSQPFLLDATFPSHLRMSLPIPKLNDSKDELVIKVYHVDRLPLRDMGFGISRPTALIFRLGHRQ